MPIRKEGQLTQADFFINTGGLNNTDSPFAVREDQATGGQNYDYIRTGGIRKRLGHQKVNSSADSQLQTLGIGLLHTQDDQKTIVRAAGTKIQAVNLTAASFTNMTEDTTAATSDFLDSASTVRVTKSQFNTSTADALWLVGGGMDAIYGAYSSTKVTKNGTVAPTGSLGSPMVASGSGVFDSTGTYWYGVSFRKASTLNEGNVDLDVSAVVSATTDEVTLDLTGITNIDTTLFDEIWIYRSATNGVEDFTTGDLIAKVASTTTSYTDTGTSLISSTNVPRAGNLILDQSTLDDAGTYQTITTFKRRLVTSNEGTLYLSDINKPEAWPTVNQIVVPSGGSITGVGIISNSSSTSALVDEFLVIFKEREVWVLTGDDYTDWSLKFIDTVGCLAQSLITNANGYIFWVDSRGLYMWAGSHKPTYISRPIERFFEKDGDIDLSKMSRGYAAFYRKQNQVLWILSHKIYGENAFALKFDLRLTLPSVNSDLLGNVVEGVFTTDINTNFGAIDAMIPPGEKEEALISGDNAGFVYRMYNAGSDGGSGIDFQYTTTNFVLGTPGTRKRFHKVIAWVEELGDWNLTLDYWSNYRTSDGDKSTKSAQISKNYEQNAGLWDVAYWDKAYWDKADTRRVPLVFNLSSENGNNEGDSIKLRFSNSGANQPVTISGFSILFSEIGVVK